MGVRRLKREAFHTLQGRLMLVVTALAIPGLFELLRTGGPVAEADLQGTVRVGAVAVAHLLMLATFCVMLPVFIARKHSGANRAEPLEAHPSFLPALRWIRLVSGIVLAAAFLTVFFHLFYGRLVAPEGRLRLFATGIHALVTLGYLFALGVPVAGLTLCYLSGGDTVTRARTLRAGSVVPFACVFPALALAPAAFARYRPDWLSYAGELARELFFLPVAPLGASEAASAGAWIEALGWVGGTVAAGTAGAAIAWRWRTYPSPATGAAGSWARGNRSRLRVRVPEAAPRWLREFLVFWGKDVTARASASRMGRYSLHTGLLAMGGALLVGLREISDFGIADPWTDLAVPAATVVVVSALAAVRSLPCLGIEGERLALLRPVLSPARLARAKAGVGLVHATAFALPHAVVLHLAGVGLGVGGVPLSVTLWSTIVVAAGLSLVGSGLGFLLPDPERTSVLLPGSSLFGRSAYAVTVVATIGALGGGTMLSPVSDRPGPRLVALSTGALAVHLPIAFTLLRWGVGRMRGAS